MSDESSAWFRDGLRFECTRCGACCTGSPGYVWVSETDIARLAESLGVTQEEFGRRYLRQVESNLSLIEKPNFECIFWDRTAGCTVYPHRPDQCRAWPFWQQNVDTPESWAATRKACPGAGRGTLFTAEDVLAISARSPC